MSKRKKIIFVPPKQRPQAEMIQATPLPEPPSPIVPGTHCDFDVSAAPGKRKIAEAYVVYAERKLPQLFELMGVPGEKIHFKFRELPKTDAANCDDATTISIGPGAVEDDTGITLHEVVHSRQFPKVGILRQVPEFTILYEGVADYFRIVASDDGAGDTGNESKRFLSPSFILSEYHDAGPEYLGWLRRHSKKPDLIQKLNKILGEGPASEIREFFIRECGDSHPNLLQHYKKHRKRILGDVPPQSINRLEYLTAMEWPPPKP